MQHIREALGWLESRGEFAAWEIVARAHDSLGAHWAAVDEIEGRESGGAD